MFELIKSPDKCRKFGLFGRKLFLEKYTWDYVGSEIKKNINKSL